MKKNSALSSEKSNVTVPLISQLKMACNMSVSMANWNVYYTCIVLTL